MTDASRSNDTIQFPFCQDLDNFHTKFEFFHYSATLFVCIFGIITNVMNFVVLTRKELRSHINYILASLALSDFLVMAIYIFYSINGLNVKEKYEKVTYGYAIYYFAHGISAGIAHTISIFLTIILALWRYISVCRPNHKNSFMKHTFLAIGISYVIAPIIFIPIWMSHKIQEVSIYSNETESNFTIYRVQPAPIFSEEKDAMISLWIYSIIIKLIPCIALTYLSLQLIRALVEAKKRKEKLTGNISIKLMKKKKQADRTTKMLLAVLILFLITEFPQGIFGLISALLPIDFYYKCYQKLGDVFDFLAIINSSINFILYCTMSRQFRQTFSEIFLPKFCLDKFPNHEKFLELESRANGETNITLDTQMTQL